MHDAHLSVTGDDEVRMADELEGTRIQCACFVTVRRRRLKSLLAWMFTTFGLHSWRRSFINPLKTLGEDGGDGDRRLAGCRGEPDGRRRRRHRGSPGRRPHKEREIMSSESATLLATLIGFVVGLVVQVDTFRQRADEPCLAGLQSSGGGSP